jgi:hypothetical protein
MPSLARIPYVDLRGYTSLELLFLYRRQARALMEAAAGTFGGTSRAASRLLLPHFDRASRRWLEKSNDPYIGEITLIAEALRIPGVFALNICLEWGCTGGVWSAADGPVLRRVLDWPFPSLGELVVVAHQSGRAGDYHNVTWPGFAGILQASAPGRFAAAINQAPMRRLGKGLGGDWLLGRMAVKRRLALPPAHLLRRVFETARDYAAAKTMLCMTPVAVPAIFILSGVKPGQGCVIERTEDAYSERDISDGRVCAANHFEAPPDDGGKGWRDRPIDSHGRFAQAMTLDRKATGFSWFTPPIANINSRLAVTANVGAGTLAVLGTAGPTPVTEVFQLPA